MAVGYRTNEELGDAYLDFVTQMEGEGAKLALEKAGERAREIREHTENIPELYLREGCLLDLRIEGVGRETERDLELLLSGGVVCWAVVSKKVRMFRTRRDESTVSGEEFHPGYDDFSF